VRFVVDILAQGQVFLPVLLFSPFHQRSIHAINYMFLPEAQTGESQEPSKKQYPFGKKRAASATKVLLSGFKQVKRHLLEHEHVL